MPAGINPAARWSGAHASHFARPVAVLGAKRSRISSASGFCLLAACEQLRYFLGDHGRAGAAESFELRKNEHHLGKLRATRWAGERLVKFCKGFA